MEGGSPNTLVEFVCASVKDYSPILDNPIDDPFRDGKIIDQGLNSTNMWGQVALVNELEELLPQDSLLVRFERRLSPSFFFRC